jgi:hypothetical protein
VARKAIEARARTEARNQIVALAPIEDRNRIVVPNKAVGRNRTGARAPKAARATTARAKVSPPVATIARAKAGRRETDRAIPARLRARRAIRVRRATTDPAATAPGMTGLAMIDLEMTGGPATIARVPTRRPRHPRRRTPDASRVRARHLGQQPAPYRSGFSAPPPSAIFFSITSIPFASTSSRFSAIPFGVGFTGTVGRIPTPW